MGIFGNKKLNEARTAGGGVYLEEGSHELKITSWRKFETQSGETALIVDFEILSSTNPTHRVGSTRNFYAGSKDIMFAVKSKGLLIAACGLGPDDPEVESEDWDKMLDVSVTKPIMVGRKLRAEGVPGVLKKLGKQAAKENPSLVDDPAWMKKNSFTRVDFRYHEDTRKELLKK